MDDIIKVTKEGTIIVSDGMGKIADLSKEETFELYKILRNYFERG